MAVIIILHYFENGDVRVIGPFTSGQTASDWGFRHLPFGVAWYWLPIDLPNPTTI